MDKLKYNNKDNLGLRVKLKRNLCNIYQLIWNYQLSFHIKCPSKYTTENFTVFFCSNISLPREREMLFIQNANPGLKFNPLF